MYMLIWGMNMYQLFKKNYLLQCLHYIYKFMKQFPHSLRNQTLNKDTSLYYYDKSDAERMYPSMN